MPLWKYIKQLEDGTRIEEEREITQDEYDAKYSDQQVEPLFEQMRTIYAILEADLAAIDGFTTIAQLRNCLKRTITIEKNLLTIQRKILVRLGYRQGDS